MIRTLRLDIGQELTIPVNLMKEVTQLSFEFNAIKEAEEASFLVPAAGILSHTIPNDHVIIQWLSSRSTMPMVVTVNDLLTLLAM